MRRSAWFAPAPPTVAVEIASRRITVVGMQTGPTLAGHASEPLPANAVVPALTGANVRDPGAVGAALRRAMERAGVTSARRAALVVPDSVARVTLLTLDVVPERPADLDEFVRWQVRKATPFALENAQLSYFPVAGESATTTLAAVVARRDVVAEYEAVAAAAGLQAGLVDLSSFNVMNAIVGTGGTGPGDGLLVHLAAEATTLTILRGDQLAFYRHRTALDEEPIGTLVHQTAMYHEDRLGGGVFERVWLAGDADDAAPVRAEIAARLRVPVTAIDLTAVGVPGRTAVELSDSLAAGVGILLRERVA